MTCSCGFPITSAIDFEHPCTARPPPAASKSPHVSATRENKARIGNHGNHGKCSWGSYGILKTSRFHPFKPATQGARSSWGAWPQVSPGKQLSPWFGDSSFTSVGMIGMPVLSAKSIIQSAPLERSIPGIYTDNTLTESATHQMLCVSNALYIFLEKKWGYH